MRIAHQVGHPQIFQIDRVVGVQQSERRLVLAVPPLASNLLMLPLQELHGLALRRRWLPCLRRATRRWAVQLLRRRSALR
jgi:hypothetical protein